MTDKHPLLARLVARELQRVNNLTYIDQALAVLRLIEQERERIFRELRENLQRPEEAD